MSQPRQGELMYIEISFFDRAFSSPPSRKHVRYGATISAGMRLATGPCH